ncbi:CsbD family protein [soil metagenome]
MNWDIIKGDWKQFTGKAREEWGKLTDSDHEQIAGNKDQLVGKLQEKYGWTKEEANQKADDWAARHTTTV